MKYLFVWGANFNPSGVYQVFVNDLLVREFDTFDLRSTVFSVKANKYYFPRNGFNSFDALVDNITEYGDIKITLKYTGSSPINRTNGFYIDYVSLIPDF